MYMSDRIFFFQAKDRIRDIGVTGVQTCALPISVEVGDVQQLLEVVRGDVALVLQLVDPLRATLGSLLRGLLLPLLLGVTLRLVLLVLVSRHRDRKRVGEGKSEDIGGRRRNKK